MKRDEQNERLDLSALDPFVERARRDRFVGAVLERSALELTRRRRAAAAGELPGWSPGATVLSVLAGWARPALAAAALMVVASGLALQLGRQESAANSGVVEALAVPTPVEDWLVEERAPATSDVILTLEGGTPW